MIDIIALPTKVTDIGRLGENEHRRVIFDVAEFLAQYPDATFGLVHSPAGGSAYPVSSTAIVNDKLVWTVLSSDLKHEGQGRCELIVTSGQTIAKSVIYMTRVLPALDGSGTAPEPWDSWETEFIRIKEEAVDAAEAIQDMGVDATTLAAGSDATVTKEVDQSGAVTLHFGIPTGPQGPSGQDGAPGRDGSDGAPGQDGISPTVSVTEITGGHQVTITDSTAHTFDVMDGADGSNGSDGQDGVSPTISASEITGGHRLTITDASGTSNVDVMDGEDGAPGQDGSDGAPGADGYSPTASVSKNGSTATITITDKSGTTTATVSDGQDGAPGQDGQDGAPGADGTTFTPSVAANGDISWTNDGGKTNPQTVNIMGPQGPSGAATVETVTGSTPSITAAANTRYVCGTVSTLSFTPSATGICDVVFTSGSTATVLTVPNTVKWPDWFDPTNLDVSTTYELNVLDGVYGAVGKWT